MRLVPNSNCILCDQNTAVLAHINTYIQFVCDTFFKTNECEKNEFQSLVSHRSICVLCAYKVELASKFKSKYENKHKKTRTTKSECGLCGLKSNEVFESDKNPNDFEVKIDLFMSCSSHPESYKQWTVCFDCMFSLSIWFELRCNILKKLNINFPVDSTKNKSSLKLSKPTSSVKMPPVRQSRRRSLNVDVALLKKHLKHLKSVKQVSRKLNCDDSIKDDKKMYKDIPYVLVVTDNKQQRKLAHRISTTAKPKAKPKPKSKQTRSKQSNNNSLNDSVKTVIERRSRRIKPVEVIELSDTDSDEGKDHKENKRPTRTRPTRTKPTKAKPANAETQKKSIAKPKSAKQVKKVKSKLSLRTKSPFKIRLSSKFILPPETVERKQTYTCSICDKQFNVNCMYKVHKLWHEKPEAIIINVTRYDFSDHIKKRESDSNKPLKKKFRIISDINIANAISKKSKVNGEQSDIDVSTKQSDVDSSENDEGTADSSNKEREEVLRKENDSPNDVEQNGTPETEERETEKNQTEKSSLEENSAVAENEYNANDKEGVEESSQEEEETTETNDEEHNEEQNVGDKEEVEDDSQKETEEDGSDGQEMEKNKGTTEEDNETDEITKNGKGVENDNEENDEQEVQDVQETEDNTSFTDEDNESENDYSNNKRNSIDDKVEKIEQQLAVLHGEKENGRDEPENDEESNGQDEPENDETENCEPLELKRKRVSNSDVSDSEENAERVTPKTKRVRFATDFNMPNDEPLDLNISNNYSEERNENLGKSWCSV